MRQSGRTTALGRALQNVETEAEYNVRRFAPSSWILKAAPSLPVRGHVRTSQRRHRFWLVFLQGLLSRSRA